jgi:uncharacterized membrane protein (UPF0127 family)
MKDTLIPLDIIWLDKELQVLEFVENALPCSADPCEVFKPNQKARYVLEINAGLVREMGLEPGAKFELAE